MSSLVADPNSAPGADEDAPITYAIATGGAGGLLGVTEQTSNEESIWYYNNAGVLEARAGADSGSADRVVFTFGVEETTGEGTFTLVDQLDHPDDSGDDATLSVDDFGQYVEATITDADLDTDSTSFDGLISVSVENDVPTLEASGDAVGGAVQEDALDNSQSVGNPDDSSDTTIATFGLSSLVADPNSAPGADEDAPITYAIATGGAGGLLGVSEQTSNEESIWYYNNAGVLEARAGADSGSADRVVFTFGVEETTGEGTFTLVDQLDHPDDSGDDATLSVDDFGQYVEATITDADLDTDSTSFDGLISVSVENDVPTLEASGDAVDGAVQEDALDNSQSLGNPDDSSDTTIATFGLSSLVADPNSAPGADEDAPITYAIATGGAGGLLGVSEQTSNEESIWYYNNAGVLEARAGADSGSADRVVFTFGVEETTGGDVHFGGPVGSP